MCIVPNRAVPAKTGEKNAIGSNEMYLNMQKPEQLGKCANRG